MKDFYLENYDKFIAREKIYSKTKNKIGINFPLICKTRCRIKQVLNGTSKSCSILELFVIDIETYRRWIDWQMTPEMIKTNIEIDHVKPTYLSDVTKDDDLKEGFN